MTMRVTRNQSLNPRNDLIEPLPCLEISEHKRQVPAHATTVSIHHRQIGPHRGREVDLVDHQQVRARDSRTAFARNLIAGRDIDHINHCVHEFWAERRGQVITAAFHEHDTHIRMAAEQFIERFLIMRRILANRGMRAPARFDTENAVLRQRTLASQKLGVFFGENIICHNRQAVPIAQLPTEGFYQCCLAGPDRPADADDRDVPCPRSRHPPRATKLFIRSMHRKESLWRIAYGTSEEPIANG